ncbi:hypothetical protein PENTCL1PPCAC_29070, partial [Pristionchus entomophagus]
FPLRDKIRLIITPMDLTVVNTFEVKYNRQGTFEFRRTSSSRRRRSIVAVVGVMGGDDGCDVGGGAVSEPSGVSEVVLAVVAPGGGEGEAGEVHRLDDAESSESDSLDALHWKTVVEVTDVVAVDRDLNVRVVGVDGEQELAVVSEANGVDDADLFSPDAVQMGIHDDDVLAHVPEAEVDVHDDVVSGEQLDGEA